MIIAHFRIYNNKTLFWFYRIIKRQKQEWGVKQNIYYTANENTQSPRGRGAASTLSRIYYRCRAFASVRGVLECNSHFWNGGGVPDGPTVRDVSGHVETLVIFTDVGNAVPILLLFMHGLGQLQMLLPYLFLWPWHSRVSMVMIN